MKILLTLLLLSFILGCQHEAKQTVPIDNPNFQVELLFEVDSCKVYRFWDGGHARYFTTCKGSASWSENHGRTSTEYEIPTQ